MASGPYVKHLWDCAIALDAETHSKKLLRSYLINTCRRIAEDNYNIPLERFASSQMCQRCSMHWQKNEFKMKLKPQSFDIKTSKARQLISKLKEQQSSKKSKLLTKKQKKRAKWLLKHAESKVEIKCELCQHKTLISLNKPVRATATDEKIGKIAVESNVVEEGVKSKKKKKKKDTTAGLKIQKPKKDSTCGNMEAKNTPASNKNLRPEAAANLTKNSQSHSPNIKKQKSTNQSKKDVPKVQSKTQKQNSLLQLAALLKSQDSNKGSNEKNRLESLLE